MSGIMVKCPWCSKVLESEKYGEHLEGHYKGKGKKRTGPYPAGVEE